MTSLATLSVSRTIVNSNAVRNISEVQGSTSQAAPVTRSAGTWSRFLATLMRSFCSPAA